MTTKDQERKALEQIRKIVDGLGEDSYIGKAFEGCFDDAESNIDNDFWNSMAQRYKGMLGKEIENVKKIKWLEEQNEEVKQKLWEAKEDAQERQKRYDKLHKMADDYANKAKENWKNFREQEDRADALELENMKLKAKLYDMMVATA